MEYNNNNSSNFKYNQFISLPKWLLFTLFIAPLVIALVIYINWNKIYFAEKIPSMPLVPEFEIKIHAHFDIKDTQVKVNPNDKKWQLVFLKPHNCDLACENKKEKLAKLHKKIITKHNNLALYSIPSPMVNINNNSRYQQLLIKENNLLVTNPNNKVIMYYEANTSTDKILQDLYKLLRNVETNI